MVIGAWPLVLVCPAIVQVFCYNSEAPQSNELYRRFWVGSIPELLQRISA